jgi:eukaryotic-like serine/threonine-protein kinase
MTLASIFPSSTSHEAFAQTEGNNTSTLSYTDPSSGITFQYPSSWQIQDVMQEEPAALSNDTISAVRLIPPGQNGTSLVENMIISAIRVDNTTLGQYTTEVLELFNNNITKSEPTTLAGNPAHSIELLETQQGQQLKKMNAWTVLGDQVYLVTYGADESEFPQYLADVQAVIESLQISNGAQVQQQQLQPGEQESPVPPFFSN